MRRRRRRALEAAFFAKFGVTPDDPAAANIDARRHERLPRQRIRRSFRRSGLGHRTGRTPPTKSSPAASPRPRRSIPPSAPTSQPCASLPWFTTMVAMLGIGGSRRRMRRNAVVDKAIDVLGDAVERSRSTLQMNLGAAAEPRHRRERPDERAAETSHRAHRRAGGRRSGRSQGQDRHADDRRSRCPTR